MGSRPVTVLLRDYQHAAIASILDAWQAHRSTLLVAATGVGKSTIFAEVARMRRPAGPVLVVAHREELITQAARRIEEQTGLRVAIEKAEQSAQMFGLYGPPDVVVASVQTLANARRLAKLTVCPFGTIIIDEAHHAVARTYRAIVDAFPDAKVLGVTATPDRSDRVGMHNVFSAVAFEYGIRQAIADGWLCPILQKRLTIESLDLSHVRSRAGDLAPGDLELAMTHDRVLHEIAGPLVELSGRRPTIVFTPGVNFAHALVEVLAGYTQAGAAAIDGSTPAAERKAILDAYARGETQYIVNCQVLTEGFDAPHTACVAVARPTKSRALYAQMIGRGTRTAPGKSDLLVLDYRDNALRHSLVGPLDVLAGEEVPSDVAERIERERDTEGYASELLDSIETAVAEERAAEKLRAEEEARQKRARIAAQARYAAEDVDPFRTFSEPAPDVTGWRATERQLAALERFGVARADYSAQQASQLLGGLFDRSRKGLASWKQSRWLIRHGYSPDVTRAEASAIMDAWARNGWRRPATG